jgi:hypothetical protein
MVQVSAEIDRSTFMFGLGNVFILHDHFHGFRGSGSMVGSRRGWRKIPGEFAMLGEGGFGDQNQQ